MCFGNCCNPFEAFVTSSKGSEIKVEPYFKLVTYVMITHQVSSISHLGDCHRLLDLLSLHLRPREDSPPLILWHGEGVGDDTSQWVEKGG